MQQLVHPLTQYVALSQIRQRDGDQAQEFFARR
jgi:hypothetical protein